MSDLPRLDVPSLVHRVLGFPAAAWREVVNLAELLSDAGHGPNAWREQSEFPNPYAGRGPADAPTTETEDETATDAPNDGRSMS